MGWRQGRGVGKPTITAAERGQSKWGGSAVTGTRNADIVILPQKDNVHGLGFDPYQVATVTVACKFV